MKEPKKEFIQGIADLFEDYEETYVPGEWEAFSQQQQKRKYPFAPLWVKIAAIVVLVGALIVYQLKDPAPANKKLAAAAPAIITKSEGQGKALPVIADDKPLVAAQLQGTKSTGRAAEANLKGVHDNTVIVRPIGVSQQVATVVSVPVQAVNGRQTKDTIIKVKAEEFIARVKALPLEKSITNKDQLAQTNKQPDSAKKMSTLDFMLAESRNPVKSKQKKDVGSKWDFGVAVAPSMSSSNVNIAGGLTTAYRLSNKFSLSSGVSLMQLESGNSVSTPSAVAKVSVSSLSDKQLLAIDANIKAIDIPIGIVYQISKNVYTSAGVSYFNVVSEKRSNTYGLTSQANEVFFNPATGYVGDRAVLNSSAVEEPVPETPLKGNSYLGFFNFSIGRKQQVFNKYNILIEPFIKVPIGRLSTQELNLMNSGLKFQISF